MNIQTEKLELIEWISKLKDTSVIDRLREIKNAHKASDDWWNELDEEERASIERGLKDIKEGRTHPHETARKIYEKYL